MCTITLRQVYWSCVIVFGERFYFVYSLSRLNLDLFLVLSFFQAKKQKVVISQGPT